MALDMALTPRTARVADAPNAAPQKPGIKGSGVSASEIHEKWALFRKTRKTRRAPILRWRHLE